MMLALAFESIVKLGAFLAVGAFVTFGLHDGPADLAARVLADPEVRALREAARPAGPTPSIGKWSRSAAGIPMAAPSRRST